MVITVQLEVAKRMVARVQEADYGLLSLLLQLRYQTAPWFKIPAGCFYPQPEIDSACVALARRSQRLIEPHQTPVFEAIVKRCFSQRRKMMFKLLKSDWPLDRLSRAFEQARLSVAIRAEAVTLEQFIQLTQLLSHEG